MKCNTNWKTLAGVALGASLIGGSAWAAQFGQVGTVMQGGQKMMSGMSCCAPKGCAAQPAMATQRTTQGQHVQRATVTIKNGYEPSTINVKAGKPVQLTFIGQGSSCANTVNFPALNQTLTVKDGEKTTLTFTPKKGTTAFSCAMGMYRGQIVAK